MSIGMGGPGGRVAMTRAAKKTAPSSAGQALSQAAFSPAQGADANGVHGKKQKSVRYIRLRPRNGFVRKPPPVPPPASVSTKCCIAPRRSRAAVPARQLRRERARRLLHCTNRDNGRSTRRARRPSPNEASNDTSGENAGSEKHRPRDKAGPGSIKKACYDIASYSQLSSAQLDALHYSRAPGSPQ